MVRPAIRLILVVVLASVAVALWRSGLLSELSLEALKSRQDTLLAWTTAHPWFAAGGFFVLYVVVTSLSLPGAAVLTLAAGALFGLVEGTILASFASSIGATQAFLASPGIVRSSCLSSQGSTPNSERSLLTP